jgi:hypothetical protein
MSSGASTPAPFVVTVVVTVVTSRLGFVGNYFSSHATQGEAAQGALQKGLDPLLDGPVVR